MYHVKWLRRHRDRCLWISILLLNIQPTILYFGCKGREMEVLKDNMRVIENSQALLAVLSQL